MSAFRLTLPFAGREAIVAADLGRGSGEAALLLPPASQAASVPDGTSNTIMFGEVAGRLPGLFEMSGLWGAPNRLRTGFGLLLPTAAQTIAQCLSLNFEEVKLESIHGRPGPAAARRGFKVSGAITAAAAANGLPGLFGVWIQPMSIICVLIAL